MTGKTEEKTTGRRAAMRDLRRGQILEAARRIFAEQGMEAATMREIAAAAGCTTGAIYPLFPGKEEIYAALLRESLAQVEAALLAAMDLPGSEAEKLKRGVLAWFGYYAGRPAEVALGLHLFRGGQAKALAPRGLGRSNDRDLNDRMLRQLDAFGAALARIGQLSGTTREIETASLFAHLIGLLMAQHTGRLKTLGQSADRLLEHHLDALIARLQWE